MINKPLIKDKLPRFIITCRSLDEYWGHIKQVSPTYKGCRKYLRDEFIGLLEIIENEQQLPADDLVTTTLTGPVDAKYIETA